MSAVDQSVKQIHEIKNLQYCQLACAALLVYEHAITLDQEVELVWKKRWSLVKVLYLLNRHIGGILPLGNAIVFLGNPRSAELCRSWAWFQAILGFMSLWSMQGILQLRVHAMCKPFKPPFEFPIPYIMCAAFVLEAVAMSLVLGFSYAHILSEPVVYQAPNMSICAPSNIRFLWAIWIPPALFEWILVVFVLWVAVKHMTLEENILQFSQDPSRRAIWTVLLRDSILFPILTVTLYTVNAILWSAIPPELVQLPEAFIACTATILGSRLVLNLRETYYMPFANEINNEDVQIVHPSSECDNANP